MTLVWKRTSPRTTSGNTTSRSAGTRNRMTAFSPFSIRRRATSAGMSRQRPAILRRQAGGQRLLPVGFELFGSCRSSGTPGRATAAPRCARGRCGTARSGGRGRRRRPPRRLRSSRAPSTGCPRGSPPRRRVEDRSRSVSSTRRMNVPPCAAREQPVEERGAGVAHVELPGGAGRKPDAHRHPAHAPLAMSATAWAAID